MRQPINNISRVPRYQNSQRIDGLCDSLVKPRLFEKRRGLVKRLKSSLRQGGLGSWEILQLGCISPSLAERVGAVEKSPYEGENNSS